MMIRVFLLWVALIAVWLFALCSIWFGWTVNGLTVTTTTPTAQHSCTEDSWCWNSLINGNHLGYVTVFQDGE